MAYWAFSASKGRGCLVPSRRTGTSGKRSLTVFACPYGPCWAIRMLPLFGQGGFERGAAKATYGTGSSVMLNIGSEALPPPRGIVTSVGWALRGRVNYVFEGNIRSSGDTLRWVGENLGLFDSFEEAESMAASLPDSGGVYLVPAFSGMGAPHWIQGARASITGLSRGSGKAHIVRAALESLAYQVRDVLASMETGGVALSELRVDGGATSNRFLMQFQADLLAASIRVASVEDVSARGAAFLAGLSGGAVVRRSRALRDRAPRRRILSIDERRHSRRADLRLGDRAAPNVLRSLEGC